MSATRWPGLGLLALLLAACGAATTNSPPRPPEASPTALTQPLPPPTATSAPTAIPPTLSPLPPSPSPSPIPSSPVPPSPIPLSPTPPQPVANASAFPDPNAYTWQVMVDGFTRPVGLTHAGDGSGRLFVIEQAGVIWIIQDGARRPDPFIDLRDRVTDLRVEYDERGLLGLAFHPRFEDNGYFYVNYTDKNGDTVIARFSLSADPARGDLASEARLIFVDQPYSNHNGGWLDFGPDGYLYIGLGDGGNAGDPENNAQNPNTLLGKLLRIDVDGDQPYAIPPDNPFANGGGAPEIWALGLRNPWRCAFDRATGDLYIGDVGQGEWEEIDFLPWGAPVGVNFGWDFREGLHPYEGIPPEGMTFTDPIAEYPHNPDYSVSGGYVYRGVNLPDWQGVYFYGDFVSGRLWGLLRAPDGSWQNQLLYETRLSIASFGEDEAGEVYLVDYKGAIYQLGPN